jgi:hypothetical protein
VPETWPLAPEAPLPRLPHSAPGGEPR